MPKYMSSFKRNVLIIFPFILFFCLEVSCTPKDSEPFFSKNGYLILSNDSTNSSDIRWAEYLYFHLKKRAADKDLIQKQSLSEGYKRIIVEIDPELDRDFKIIRDPNQVKLIAINNQSMLWLIYQFIKSLSINDPRFDAADLPPAIIGIENTSTSFAFKYRAIYSPTNLQPDYAGIAGTNNIENEWGIWGHNLNKVVGKNVSQDMYALVNGERNQKQFCFSSNTLYTQIEAFILENYGEKNHNLFLIAPNDNSLVCQCPYCKEVGNTFSKATPAVTHFIVRLAKRFPKHSFFTISYLTTREAPNYSLPFNVGVLISAIGLPYNYGDEDSSLKTNFADRIKKWKAATSNIYVWDYMNNFDDYLTPFPLLYLMQERFRFFKKNGVSGLFLNGSGYEYSSLDDLKTFVLSALMINPELSVDRLTGDFLEVNYPITKDLINDYYLSLEKKVSQNNKKLNIYGGTQDAINTYLDKSKFIDFYNTLSDTLEQLKGEERKKVHKLLIALSFSRLELARLTGYGDGGCYTSQANKTHLSPKLQESMNLLQTAAEFADMKYYNESESTISGYLNDWNKYIVDRAGVTNLLTNKDISPLSSANGKKMSTTLLTDGIRGLPSGYHFGWEISTQPVLEFEISIADIIKAKQIEIGFLQQKKHNILAPTRVEIWSDNQFKQVIELKKTEENTQGEIWTARGSFAFESNRKIKLRIIPAKADKVQTALDEILLTP